MPATDVVTETDKAVEDMVSTTLKDKYPTYPYVFAVCSKLFPLLFRLIDPLTCYRFLGEETYKPGMRLTPFPTFVCDPIDGTMNFIHAQPYVSISLAFVDGLVPLVGVVYNPFNRNLYHAIRGQGAFLTTPSDSSPTSPPTTRRLPLRPAAPLALDRALIAVEWGSERTGPNWSCRTETFISLAAHKDSGGGMVHGVRCLGSAALNLCGVAAGEMDAYWEGGCWAWDVAAGWVILEEAGGKVVGANPGEWKIPVDGRRYLAIRWAPNGEEEKKGFIEDFWSHVKGRMEYDV